MDQKYFHVKFRPSDKLNISSFPFWMIKATVEGKDIDSNKYFRLSEALLRNLWNLFKCA